MNHLAGRREESDDALRRLEAGHGGDSAFQIAAVHAARGEADAAFDWMEKCAAQRDAGCSLIYAEPAFRPVHDDPRWNAFLRKMKFVT